MKSLKNILVPTDFSDNSVQAFEYGVMLAKQNNSNLHLLHVIDPLYTHQQHKSYESGRIEKLRQEEAQNEMAKFIRKTESADVSIVPAISNGKPCDEILSYAKAKLIDLIVITTHGWTSLSNILMGNICEKVVRDAEIPVISVKSNNVIPAQITQKKRGTFAENWVG